MDLGYTEIIYQHTFLNKRPMGLITHLRNQFKSLMIISYCCFGEEKQSFPFYKIE